MSATVTWTASSASYTTYWVNPSAVEVLAAQNRLETGSILEVSIVTSVAVNMSTFTPSCPGPSSIVAVIHNALGADVEITLLHVSSSVDLKTHVFRWTAPAGLFYLEVASNAFSRIVFKGAASASAACATPFATFCTPANYCYKTFSSTAAFPPIASPTRVSGATKTNLITAARGDKGVFVSSLLARNAATFGRRFTTTTTKSPGANIFADLHVPTPVLQKALATTNSATVGGSLYVTAGNVPAGSFTNTAAFRSSVNALTHRFAFAKSFSALQTASFDTLFKPTLKLPTGITALPVSTAAAGLSDTFSYTVPLPGTLTQIRLSGSTANIAGSLLVGTRIRGPLISEPTYILDVVKPATTTFDNTLTLSAPVLSAAASSFSVVIESASGLAANSRTFAVTNGLSYIGVGARLLTVNGVALVDPVTVVSVNGNSVMLSTVLSPLISYIPLQLTLEFETVGRYNNYFHATYVDVFTISNAGPMNPGIVSGTTVNPRGTTVVSSTNNLFALITLSGDGDGDGLTQDPPAIPLGTTLGTVRGTSLGALTPPPLQLFSLWQSNPAPSFTLLLRNVIDVKDRSTFTVNLATVTDRNLYLDSEALQPAIELEATGPDVFASNFYCNNPYASDAIMIIWNVYQDYFSAVRSVAPLGMGVSAVGALVAPTRAELRTLGGAGTLVLDVHLDGRLSWYGWPQPSLQVRVRSEGARESKRGHGEEEEEEFVISMTANFLMNHTDRLQFYAATPTRLRTLLLSRQRRGSVDGGVCAEGAGLAATLPSALDWGEHAGCCGGAELLTDFQNVPVACCFVSSSSSSSSHEERNTSHVGDAGSARVVGGAGGVGDGARGESDVHGSVSVKPAVLRPGRVTSLPIEIPDRDEEGGERSEDSSPAASTPSSLSSAISIPSPLSSGDAWFLAPPSQPIPRTGANIYRAVQAEAVELQTLHKERSAEECAAVEMQEAAARYASRCDQWRALGVSV